MDWAPTKVPRLYIKIRIFFVLNVEPEGRPSINNLLWLVWESAYWANDSVSKKTGSTLRRRGNEDRQVLNYNCVVF